MEMEQTECSETSEYKIQTPGNYPAENIQREWRKLHKEELYGLIQFETCYWLRVFENRVLRKIFASKRDEVTGSGENYLKRNFMMCIPHQILFG